MRKPQRAEVVGACLEWLSLHYSNWCGWLRRGLMSDEQLTETYESFRLFRLIPAHSGSIPASKMPEYEAGEGFQNFIPARLQNTPYYPKN